LLLSELGGVALFKDESEKAAVGVGTPSCTDIWRGCAGEPRAGE
jgi:hypothetical protein